jgi:beta-lactam-binding protein with PASTA domain
MRLFLKVLAGTAALAVAGCGAPSEPVPDVVGERLDVAKSEVEDAGYDAEEIGGGTFGIVVESNWTVCDTDPPAGQTGDGTVKLIVDRVCETATMDAAAEQSAAAQGTPKKKRKRRNRQPAPAPAHVTVPNVVGMDHQAAQNHMQDVGLYNLRERDGTGQGRMLLWDRNWVVIAQKPAPGAPVSESAKITLVSVKDGEQ